MPYKFAGQNKLAQRELVTNQSGYQQQAAIYDALVDVVRRDPRLLSDAGARLAINRSQNLLHAESTDIFRRDLENLQKFVAANPDPSRMDYKALINMLKRPSNTFGTEANQIRGWHKGEVHHMVPASQVARKTSALPYRVWGDTLHAVAQEVPITSSAFNGVENRSEPGHQLSHYDVFGRQFFKGDTPDPVGIIRGDALTDEAIHQLTDSARAARLISTIGGQADAEVFLPALAERVSSRIGRMVKPEEFSSTRYSSEGRGRTEAAHIRDYTDEELVTAATEEAFGGVVSDGAQEYLEQRGATGAFKTSEERRLERNAKARERRRTGPMTTPTPTLRSDIDKVLGEIGMEHLIGAKLG